MKSLTIVRHAKSSWKYDVIDYERPLKERGINDAKTIAQCLRKKSIHYDKILSSDALRARSTAEIFIKNLDLNSELLEFNHKLYDFEGRDLINVIKKCDDKINNLLLFGHNHAITAFVNSYGSIFIDNIPTSGVVIIEFKINSWQELKPGNTLVKLFPKELNMK
ncbi:histidine phosphatase family protein [Seonamhaeicola sp. ML3]|uniref:SixA phosphatase family protein n=1 Tax=Seonamhaeicola sp. ML3 TaxID=2937786 RepID=UPI00200E0E8A|nr:histidine phosphatase family protein [Seonamhaeicola sp. ML3]